MRDTDAVRRWPRCCLMALVLAVAFSAAPAAASLVCTPAKGRPLPRACLTPPPPPAPTPPRQRPAAKPPVQAPLITIKRGTPGGPNTGIPPVTGALTPVGSSNLSCLAFEGRSGPEARSALVNRCGTAVRFNYCFQGRNGSDNCFPMAIGGDATLWDLNAGQSMVMPGSDLIKLWAVFACQAPLTPWKAKFLGGALSGTCVEKGFEPIGGGGRIVRSDDASTWPPGTTNMACLAVAPTLGYINSVHLRTTCAKPIIVGICVDVISGLASGVPSCAGSVGGIPRHLGVVTTTLGLFAPNHMTRWAAFACEAPAEPQNMRYEGGRLTGDCIDPAAGMAAALPRRAQSAASARLSAESDAAERAARERARVANRQTIESERSRMSAESGAFLGALVDVAVVGAQAYVQMEQQQAQIDAASALAQQQAAAQAQQQMQQQQQAAQVVQSSGSGGGVSKVDATSCIQYTFKKAIRAGDLEHHYENICKFEVQAWFSGEGMSPDQGSKTSAGAIRSFRDRKGFSAFRFVE